MFILKFSEIFYFIHFFILLNDVRNIDTTLNCCISYFSYCSKVYYMLQNRDLVVMIFNIFHKKKI